MSQTIPANKLTYLSSLDIINSPNYDISLLQSDFIQVFPLNSIKENSQITFRIAETSSPNLYYDFSASYIHMKVRVSYSDKSVLKQGAEVAIPSSFFYTIFKNATVSIQGKCISDSNQMNCYRGILSSLLAKSDEQKKSEMSMMMYYPDLICDKFEDSNLGYKKRKEICKESKIFDMLGKLS